MESHENQAYGGEKIMLVKSVPSSPFGYSDGLTRGGKSSVDIRCKYTMSDSIQIQQFILLFFLLYFFHFLKT